MIKLIKKILLLILFIFILFYLVVYSFKFNEIPPVLTVSLSFDEKMLFLRDCHIEKADFIVLGSSMSLNQLNSGILSSSIKGHSYLNLSSWGLQISDIYYLLKYFVRKYNPKCIMIATCLTDFLSRNAINEMPKYYEFDMFFSEKFDWYFLLKNRQIEDLFKRKKEINAIKTNTEFSKRFYYDENGGISFDFPKSSVDSSKKLPVPLEFQYDVLKKIVDWLSDENIKFVFVQCPVKKNNYKDIENKIILYNYFERTKKIVLSGNQIYLNLHNEEVYKDYLFNDALHLDVETSKYFTYEIVKNINLDSLLN